FLATMSHEIRTPLNGILGMAQAMSRDLDGKQKGQLKIIQTSGETLLALLNDLLDMSKVASGKVEFENGVVDVEELMRAAEIFAPLAQQKGVDFGIVAGPSVHKHWSGDPKRVQQVLNNLVANAVKFTDRGVIGVEITQEADSLVFRVRDSGIGIPPERLGEIFDRFVQVDASTTRRFGGTGLGLAICRDLVRQMDGEIDVESTADVGTTFTVSLPLAPIDVEPSSLRPASAAGETPPSVGLRLLAAEDNATNQLVLKTLLGAVGIEPEIVSNGAAALEAWRGGAWDIVLMDIQMPVMDGIAATRAIRESESQMGRHHTPIVALTANAMPHHRAEYIAAGMDGFVAKPIDLSLLLQAIETALSARELKPLAVAA
ncbi:MAG TPA: ATP-binding protein, partial [Caulobacteraceae bacterium]|nr:ATP-binding protein [Caulobacteraceae bacterium]